MKLPTKISTVNAIQKNKKRTKLFFSIKHIIFSFINLNKLQSSYVKMLQNITLLFNEALHTFVQQPNAHVPQAGGDKLRTQLNSVQQPQCLKARGENCINISATMLQYLDHYQQHLNLLYFNLLHLL